MTDMYFSFFFFLNDPPPPEFSPLPPPDPLPICHGPASAHLAAAKAGKLSDLHIERIGTWGATRINEMCGKCHRGLDKIGTADNEVTMTQDRKSTRLNSSHSQISYAVFCLKKKKQ